VKEEDVRKISVQNLKGGTGKSTTVVNLGAALALRGKKVLLIDTDSQAHVGMHLGVKHSVTLFDLMTIDLSIEEAIIPARENLDCIISDKKVAVLESMLVQMPRREEILRLRARRLKNLRYDYVLVDCSPSISLMHQNALLFADYLLIPVSMDVLSLAGASSIMDSSRMLLQMYEMPLQILGVLPTIYDGRLNMSKEVVSILETNYAKLTSVLTPIRTDVKLKEAAAAHQTIFEYDPKSRGAEDYMKLAEEITELETRLDRQKQKPAEAKTTA
jgi:chromosome partitioning protein